MKQEKKLARDRAYREANKDRLNEYVRNWRVDNRKEMMAQRAEYRQKSTKLIMLSSARRRALAANIAFSIVADDIFIPEQCPLLGISLKRNGNKASGNSPSLDRINNSEGYVRGNIWVISHRANLLKRDATPDELLMLATNLKLLTTFLR